MGYDIETLGQQTERRIKTKLATGEMMTTAGAAQVATHRTVEIVKNFPGNLTLDEAQWLQENYMPEWRPFSDSGMCCKIGERRHIISFEIHKAITKPQAPALKPVAKQARKNTTRRK